MICASQSTSALNTGLPTQKYLPPSVVTHMCCQKEIDGMRIVLFFSLSSSFFFRFSILKSSSNNSRCYFSEISGYRPESISKMKLGIPGVKSIRPTTEIVGL